MLSIDVNTIYVTLLLGNFMTVLLVLSYALHYKDRMINLYIIGKSIECLGFLVAFIREGVHPFVPIGIGNSLLIAGVCCETLAMLSIAGYSSRKLRNTFIFGGIIAGILFNIAFFLGANTSQRIAMMSLITIGIVSLPTVKFLSDPKASALRKMVGFLYLSQFQKSVTFEIGFAITCGCVATAAINRGFQGSSLKTF